MDNKKILMVAVPIFAVLIAAIAILSYIQFSKPSSDDMYLQHIQSAKNFLDEGDVDRAITCYRDAIRENPEEEEAYLELAEVYYVRKSDLDAAIAVLREGYERTHSEELQNAINRYTALENLSDDISDDSTIGKLPAKGVISDAYMNVFSTYTYQDYVMHCTMTSEHNYTTAYIITYSQYNAEFEYSNTAENPNVRDRYGKPLSGSRPTLIRVSSVGDLIGVAESGVTADDLKAAGAKDVNLNKAKDGFDTPFISFRYAGCIVSVACDDYGVIHPDSPRVTVKPPASETQTVEKPVVSGQVMDAVSNISVDNAELKFRSGNNAQGGNTAAEVRTSGGSYSVELYPGSYTVEVSAEGYITEFFDLNVPDGETEVSASFVLSPKLEQNQMRFVVEWSNTQKDLYLHIRGTNSKNETVQFWEYGTRSANSGESVDGLENGTSNGKRFTAATITDAQGTYEFHVHGGKDQFDKQQLLDADVVVKIYKDNNTSPMVLNIPSSFPLSYWVVCSVHNGEIYVID